MKRITLILMALMMLIIGACFHESVLEVRNNSSAEAWVSVENGPEYHIPAKGSSTLSYPSPRTMLIHYHGHHILPGQIFIDMNVAGGNYMSLEPNCGALRLQNSSDRDIGEIRVSPAGQNTWGENVLQTDLEAHEDFHIRLSPGFYDLRIKDRHGNIFYISAQEIVLDLTRTYLFSGINP